ncbi:hypothetical protein QQP08_022070 [Theobroma cacao]|nr:hypothetical protein QQP08_022070 [Theobroma cacao]
MSGLIPKASEMKSVAILPLEKRPVGLPPRKSRPYGAKLLFRTVDIWLLFPGSTVESPNTMIAGTIALVSAIWNLNSNIARKKVVTIEESRTTLNWIPEPCLWASPVDQWS